MYNISVVVTTYNRKYEVRRALDSVYAQSVIPYEILLVDDCSNDGTREYIESFGFNNLTYFQLPKRMGPGAARNYGIRQASGKYIAFLDSDNEWKSTKLEEFVLALNNSEVEYDVIYSKYMKHVNFETEIMPKELGKMQYDIWMHNPSDASSTIYKKEFLEQVGMFSEKLVALIDWELLLRGSKITNFSMKKIDKILSENWTMFDGITEDKELVRKERAMLFNEYASEFFEAIKQNNKVIEQQYQNDREHYREVEEYYQEQLARKNSFYQLMCNWMRLKLVGGSLSEKLLQKGIKNIAIYGAGKHGLFLYQDLSESSVKVSYFIDCNKANLQEREIPVYAIEEQLPFVDAIVVSPYLEYDLIKQELIKKCDYRLIALDELLEW